MEGRKISILLFIMGVSFIIASFLTGEAKAGLFIIFPFIYGTGLFMFVGIILIFISMLLFFFSFPYEKGYEIEEKKGGLILIGPIPIIITDDRKIGLLLLIISLVFIFLFLLIFMLYKATSF